MQQCGNCRYSDGHVQDEEDGLRCRRNAPVPYDFFRYYLAELVRSIAHEYDRESTEVQTEATEAYRSSLWPIVKAGDWCGEWQAKEKED